MHHMQLCKLQRYTAQRSQPGLHPQTHLARLGLDNLSAAVLGALGQGIDVRVRQLCVGSRHCLHEKHIKRGGQGKAFVVTSLMNILRLLCFRAKSSC